MDNAFWIRVQNGFVCGMLMILLYMCPVECKYERWQETSFMSLMHHEYYADAVKCKFLFVSNT